MLTHFFLPTLHSRWNFPNQGLNPCPLHWTLKSLNHQESQEMLTFINSVQSLSRVQLCDPMNCSTQGFLIHHQLLELTQTHVHWVTDAIQPSHPLSPPSPTLNLSQHQGLFKWVFSSGGQSIGVSGSASVLPMNIQDWSPSEWTGGISLQSKGLSRVFSNTIVQKHQFFSAQLSL